MRRAIIASRARPRKLARLLAAAAVALALPVLAQDERVRDSAEQLDKLRARIQAVQRSLERDRGRRDELRGQLEDAERRFTALAGELAGLRREIAAQSKERRRTEQQRRTAEADLARHRVALTRQIRAAYVIGQRGKTKLLLNQDRSQRLARVMTYYDYLNRARAQRMATIQAQAQALAALVSRLRQQTAELEATRTQHQGTLTALEAVRAERQETIAALAARIATGEGELEQLHADEKELTRLLDELRTVLADIPANLGARPFAGLKGRLPWPLRGKLLARFGDPKARGGLKWNGLWIAGSEGAAVKAVARGRVAYVGWMHRYGLITVLEHEGGWYSLYGHNESVAVGVGDWVQPGDVIAAVGATGGHQKSGLYFELRKGTDPVNPRPWLRGKT